MWAGLTARAVARSGRAGTSGVGKLWQYSAVDGATSFAVARVVAGEESAAAAARFLRDDVVPVFRELHIGLMTATVDGGPGFQGEFRRACSQLGIVRHQLPARSPNLNASVERFQGSCLNLHYRNAFRYRFYAGAADVDADSAGLAALLQLRTAPPGLPPPRPATGRHPLPQPPPAPR